MDDDGRIIARHSFDTGNVIGGGDPALVPGAVDGLADDRPDQCEDGPVLVDPPAFAIPADPSSPRRGVAVVVAVKANKRKRSGIFGGGPPVITRTSLLACFARSSRLMTMPSVVMIDGGNVTQ